MKGIFLEHALEDPTSAMNKDAFTVRDRIQRTPLKKDNQLEERRSSHDALQSYLKETLPSESGLTPNPTHHIKSLGDTPKNGLFDSPFYSRTPQQTLFESANVGGVSKDYGRHRKLRVNDFDTEEQAVESPRFDEEFQTPIVNRAIELSVRSSILDPKDFSDSLGDTPIDTPTKYIKNSKEEVSIAMSPFANETKLMSQSPSLSSYSSAENMAFTEKVAGPNMVAKEEKIEISPEFIGCELSESIPKISENHSSKPVQKEMQLSSSKDDLAELILRYKNLKKKSQKTNIRSRYDAEGKTSCQDESAETVDEWTSYEKGKSKSNRNESIVSAPNLSFNVNGDAPSRNNQSFIEIARNSATKDVSTWATLKQRIAAFEDNDEQRLKSNYDSFEDLQIPVAKQLSFLQLDTRAMSPATLRQENHLSIARRQYSPDGRLVGGNYDNRDLGSHTPEYFVKPVQPDLIHQSFETDGSPLFGVQKEARPLVHLRNQKDERNDTVPKSELREPRSSKDELHVETSESKTPLPDSPFDSVDQYFTNNKKSHKEIPNDLKMSYSILETPKRRTLDESFNILTPGLELQRGVELFAMDVEPSGLDGGCPGAESEHLDQDVNLIDF